MSLQLLKGPSGSGKSHYLYEYVADHAASNPGQRHLVLVPEQFTLQTQRQLVMMSENQGIMNIEVLSFERLAYRVFDELGATVYDILEDTGKSLLLRKICDDLKDKLNILNAGISKAGFIDELKSLLSEFALYGITPDNLGDFLRMENMGETYYSKVEDVITVYRQYEAELEGRYLTAEQILTKLLMIVEDSVFIRDSFLAFDGFTGFTPVQKKLFEKMLVLSREVWVTVTADISVDTDDDDETALFAMSTEYIRSMQRLANNTKTKINKPILFSETGGVRFVNGGVLEHLERSLFRKNAPVMEDWQKCSDSLDAYVFSDTREELIFVASEIRRMISGNSKLKYRDFAVLCADIKDYQYITGELFDACEIPVFVDTRDTVMRDPFIELVEAVVHLYVQDFSYESVMRYLKCQIPGIASHVIDLIDNYLLATGIRGLKRWEGIFDLYADGISPEEMVEINEARVEIMKPLAGERGLKKSASAEEFTKRLYYILTELECEEKLKEREKQAEEEQDNEEAQKVKKLYPMVMDLLDKIVRLMGEVSLEIDVYEEILKEGLKALKVGVIPPSLDSVIFGDIERSRIGDIKILFLIGLSDANIPRRFEGGGILLQSERERLKQSDIVLAPTDRENALLQRFYLYLAITKPSRRLILCSPRKSSDGDNVGVSYLIPQILSCYSGKNINRIPEEKLKFMTASLNTLAEDLSDSVREYERGKLSLEYRDTFFGLMKVLKEEDANAYESLIKAAWFVHNDAVIPQTVIRTLYSDTLNLSASRLEQYAACAYAYFLRYILSLKERKEHRAGAKDTGNLYHEALERYSRKLSDMGRNWHDISESESEKLLNESISETFMKLKEVNMFDSAREAYILKRMKRTLRRTVKILTSQVRKGQFEPKGFELSLSEWSADSMAVPLTDNMSMRITGIIDRMDWYETDSDVYIKIIDYKSGSKDVNLSDTYEGLQLQLLLYLKAAREGCLSEKPVHSAAVFYYHISDPIILSDNKPTREEIERLIEKELKLRGITCDRSDVIYALDTGIRDAKEQGVKYASACIPVEIKTDGTYSAASRILSENDFTVLENYAHHKSLKLARDISEGKIEVNPYRKKDKTTGCDYCPYHAVCKFDTGLIGFKYKKLFEENDDGTVISMMKKEMADAVDESAETGN